MEHSEIQEQIPLYAIGGMSAEESSRVAAHLEICPGCRALLSEYRFVTEELLVQVPPHAAPERIGVRLQNLAAADALKSKPPTMPEKVPFWKKMFVIPRWGLALALLALLLLLGTTGVLAWQLRNTPRIDEVAQVLTARDLKILPLKASETAADTSGGFICLVPGKSTALLWMYGMPHLDYDHAYQVWLKDGDTRVSGGLFRPNYDGRAVAVINAPLPLSEFKEIGITVEPSAGSPGPTTPRVVGGELY